MVRIPDKMTEKLKSETERIACLVNERLSEICDEYENSPEFTPEMKAVTQAVRYSLTAGGKRIRPFLVFSFCKLCKGSQNNALILASAIEMVHTYSLIHDDLPCMDNDDFRRGKPTNHKVFGEATAVLAGDALLTEAFARISESNLNDKAKIRAISVLAKRAGILGMVGGQEIDLSSEGKSISLETLLSLQKKKTGMLIEAACLLGCIAADCYDEEKLSAAVEFANAFGLAFQITDDILDATGSFEELGKTIGSDEKESKNTFVSHFGTENAKNEAQKYINIAKNALIDVFGTEDTDLLCELSDYLQVRRS